MTPSNLILHWFNRLWVGHPDFSNHGLPNGFGFPKNLTQDIHPKTQKVLDGCFFFSDPTSDIIHRQKTPRYLDLKSNCGWKSWVWVVTSASCRLTPGWMDWWLGWLGFKEDAEDLIYPWISTRKKSGWVFA